MMYFLRYRLYLTGLCFLIIGGMLGSCREEALEVGNGLSELPEGMVQVELPVELEDGTDGYDLLPQHSDTRAQGNKSAVDVRIIPDVPTRLTGTEDPLKTAKPEKIYELHILQLNQSGGVLTNTGTNYVADTPIVPGKKVTLKLAASNDCQLILYARGGISSESGAAGGSLNGSNWTTFKVPAARIYGITDETTMKNMPYILHLKHVKVIAGATSGEGILQNVTGEDVRLRMKRLAARLNVTWNYNVAGYTLQEVTLQDIPLNYIAFPSQTEDAYPSIVDQFTTKAIYVRGETPEPAPVSFSYWMPRNVRGTVNITSPIRRGKNNAPVGSAYLKFVATDNANPKRKLVYRIYLGGNTTTDFNVLDNTNYNYQLNFSHVSEDIWKEDDRVEYLNGGISASENNNTPVPTANCFMVEPGGNFNFDPFLFHQVGQDIENTTLTGWTKGSRGGIASVKLVWQTRENGDVGDPVVGIVNSSTDHSNIVEVKRTDGTSIETTPAKLPGECRIYCRVAANTTGGNGLIAAYDASGKILWSWHLWVTDYSPGSSGDATVLEPATKRKMKYTFRADLDQPPMMDRHLGARAGYVDIPTTEIERSMANGLHYQWGRKDPFPGSYTTKTISSVTANASVPVEGLLNLYSADGYTFLSRNTSSSRVTIETSCTNPTVIYNPYGTWYTPEAQYWGSGTNKTYYDPCPQGWRVPEGKNYYHLFQNGNGSGAMRSKNTAGNYVNNGGVLAYCDASNSITTYFRLTGYQEKVNLFNYIGLQGNVWCREHTGGQNCTMLCINPGGYPNHRGYDVSSAWYSTDAQNLRCIQEQK